MNGVLVYFEAFFLITVPRSRASDKPDTNERQRAARDKFSSIISRRPFKISIEDCTADNDRESKENELRGNDLGGIESTQTSVEILDLHHSSQNKDGDKQVCYRKRESLEQGI
jgi:hypothetical protein